MAPIFVRFFLNHRKKKKCKNVKYKFCIFHVKIWEVFEKIEIYFQQRYRYGNIMAYIQKIVLTKKNI